MGTNNSTGSSSKRDSVTGTDITISYAHHEIHAGSTYHISYHDESLGGGGTIEFILTVSSTKVGHLIIDASNGAEALFEIYEAPTSVSGGTALSERNKNRVTGDGGNTITAVRDPTSIGSDGALLDDSIIQGGSGFFATGGSSSERNEWVLATNTTYLIRLTNLAGTSQPAHLRAEWYEESV